MASDKKDDFIDELDRELQAIDSQLKKVLSKANALLKEHRGTAEEADEEGTPQEEYGP